MRLNITLFSDKQTSIVVDFDLNQQMKSSDCDAESQLNYASFDLMDQINQNQKTKCILGFDFVFRKIVFGMAFGFVILMDSTKMLR